MKASEKFKTAIENYLSEKAQNDAVFAPALAKQSKNLESCLNYIFGEVKKTGECAFDNQEIFDMAEKYYSDDSIGRPAPIQCRVAVSPPAKPDLFSTAPAVSENAVSENTVKKTETVTPSVKPVQKTLTLFDL
ncbi:Cas9 inhibitor AcrIIA9 family protein [uncultured Flavobacterium sp.]|uniref:Cas9 inhibitor AcrIIA9 family protein n=1 Tax=uncultured Flavobacterium sp. TaxID=165435 RepID=UPI0025F452AE|nr:Cas9 inhibitor AcrIIA9 family protein [uncultured Flavobacterium sp.]